MDMGVIMGNTEELSDVEKFARHLKDFWQYQIDSEIMECATHDEWCEAQLYRTASRVIKCIVDREGSVDECFDRVALEYY